MPGRNISLFNLHQHKDRDGAIQLYKQNRVSFTGWLRFKLRTTQRDLLQTNTEMRHLYFSPGRFSFYVFYVVVVSD